jgi:recombinational DNA repair protein (RecF pathway)
MSYVTYTTEAIVCGSFDQNTADRSFLLFTKDAGMLFAVAKSVREERSLQRPALQDFSRIRVSLVKGKTGWRVGSVEAVSNDYALATTREMRGSVVALYRLLRRFIRGEEPVGDLYGVVADSLDVLLGDLQNRRLAELKAEVEILALLGYVDATAIPKTVQGLALREVALMTDPKLEAQLEVLISKARENSHL